MTVSSLGLRSNKPRQSKNSDLRVLHLFDTKEHHTYCHYKLILLMREGCILANIMKLFIVKDCGQASQSKVETPIFEF